MSSYERACLVGAYHSLGVKDTIDPRIANRGYTPEQLEILEKRTITKQLSYVSCGLSITGDIKQFKEPNIGYYLEAFYAYDNHGVLPFPGAFTEQPSKMIDVFEVMSQLKHEEENKIRQQIDREQKRAERGRR